MYNASQVQGAIRAMAGEVPRPDMIRKIAEMCLGWPYVYAAAGEMCTPEWRKNRMGVSPEPYPQRIRDTCPVLSGSAASCAGCKWDGCRCFDCRGFTCWLLEQAEITLAGGGATSQWDTASNWVAKGTIDTMPQGLVCCVFKRKDGKMSHTGMSMGDGAGGVIHCSTTVKRGNAYTDYSKWTHWGIPRGLYSNKELREAGINVQDGDNLPTLRRGSRGDAVKRLQVLLNEQTGAGLKVDGNFGAKTESAVIHFQELNSLHADGIVGPKTWAALSLDKDTNVPGKTPEAPEPAPDPNPDGQPDTITIPLVDWNGLKAAVQAAYHIIKRYEG